MKKLLLLPLIIYLLVSGCKPPVANQTVFNVKDMLWLKGQWINRNDSPAITYENWEVVNNDLMKGEGFTIEAGDTVFHEQMELKKVDDTLAFVVVTANQNDEKPVVFKLKNAGKGKAEFYNAMHDFPNTIAYEQINKDSLSAYVSGKNNGKDVRLAFPFKRL